MGSTGTNTGTRRGWRARPPASGGLAALSSDGIQAIITPSRSRFGAAEREREREREMDWQRALEKVTNSDTDKDKDGERDREGARARRR